jgi:hypothetical protein
LAAKAGSTSRDVLPDGRRRDAAESDDGRRARPRYTEIQARLHVDRLHLAHVFPTTVCKRTSVRNSATDLTPAEAGMTQYSFGSPASRRPRRASSASIARSSPFPRSSFAVAAHAIDGGTVDNMRKAGDGEVTSATIVMTIRGKPLCSVSPPRSGTRRGYW